MNATLPAEMATRSRVTPCSLQSGQRSTPSAAASPTKRRMRLPPVLVLVMATAVLLILDESSTTTVTAFSPPPSCCRRVGGTTRTSFLWSADKQQQRRQKKNNNPVPLSIAHSPIRQGDDNNTDENHSWSSSSSSDTDDFDMEWRTLIGSYEPDECHHHHHPGTLSSSSSTTLETCCTKTVATGDKWSLGLTATGVVVLLGGMFRFSGPGAWRYYLAGGVCAALSHAIPVPVDVVKTRKQVDPEYCDLTMPVAVRKLINTEGWSSLWVGLGPTFWGYFMEGAVKFGVYEILKPWLGLVFTHQFLNFVACATVSGCAASVMLCPMEALRIRLVAEPAYAAHGWLRGGLRMVQREGLSGLTRGLTPMLYKQVPYTITKNVSFDFLTKLFYKYGASALPAASVMIPLVSAAVASVLSCLSSQPGDMLLSLVNAHEGERRRTRDWIRQIMHSDRGVRGFLVGIKTRLLHVGMIVTVQLLVYDFVKRLVGIAATGSV